ncbi:MAG: LAGLIDADG family homing endonuclease [Nitrospiraceae bacterium]
MSTDLELAWAAGFFDGDGCIHIRWSKNKQLRLGGQWILQVTMTQIYQEVIEEFQRIVGGGKLYRCAPTRGSFGKRWQWRWIADAYRAEKIVRLLLPHLRLKKPQAEAALDFRATFRTKGRYNLTKRLPDRVCEKRAQLAAQVKALKLVGAEEVCDHERRIS